MGRPIFDAARIHPAVRDKIADWGVEIVREVQDVVASKAVVVVGMKMNPAPRRARRLLDGAGLSENRHPAVINRKPHYLQPLVRSQQYNQYLSARTTFQPPSS
jgi:hypothetical protein